MMAVGNVLTGKLTGTPATISEQQQTSIDINLLYKTQDERPGTSTNIPGRISPSAPLISAFSSLSLNVPITSSVYCCRSLKTANFSTSNRFLIEDVRRNVRRN